MPALIKIKGGIMVLTWRREVDGTIRVVGQAVPAVPPPTEQLPPVPTHELPSGTASYHANIVSNL